MVGFKQQEGFCFVGFDSVCVLFFVVNNHGRRRSLKNVGKVGEFLLIVFLWGGLTTKGKGRGEME